MEMRTVGGSYFPSFFCIKIETSDVPEKFLSNKNVSTIAHEYIHFLQNASTVFCMANTSNVFKDIFYFYNIKDDKIVLPYRFSSDLEIREINNNLFEIYFNRCDYHTVPTLISINIIETSAKDYFIEGFPELKAFEIEISSNGHSEKYGFGAFAIMEGMANMIENHMYPKAQVNGLNIPYDLPGIVANYIYAPIFNNKAFLVALCDMSLMYYHPAEVFIKILRIMADSQFVPQTIYDIYNFVHNHLQIPGATFKTFWHNTYNNTCSDIMNLVNVETYNNARNWALDSLKLFYDIRNRDITFISQLMLLSPADAQHSLFSFIQKEAAPPICNNNMQFGLIGGNAMPEEKKEILFTGIICQKFLNIYFIIISHIVLLDFFVRLVKNVNILKCHGEGRDVDIVLFSSIHECWDYIKEKLILPNGTSHNIR